MTDKVHFDDLTKINVPFGLLDEDTQTRLQECGGPWELLGSNMRWIEAGKHNFYVLNVCRLKPELLTKPSVPWDALLFDYVARDENGSVWNHQEKPEVGISGWDSFGGAVRLTGIIRHDLGTCDWRDSLVVRPGKEDEA